MNALAIAQPKAIIFGGFRLEAEGLVVKGKPEFGDWQSALHAAVYLEERSAFWKADLLEYGHKRADWDKLIDAVVDASRFTASTVTQYRYVSRSVPPENRVEGLYFGHHEAVASLPTSDQRGYLEQAKREHLSVSALKQVVRKAKKVRRVLSGQASELAHAHEAVVECAHAAADWCKQIPWDDCAKAEKTLAQARRELDRCEAAIGKLRKVQGK